MQYYVMLDNPEPGFDDCFESSILADASEELEAVEKHLKIKSHFELFSYTVQNDLCPPGYEETEIPWFEPDEGIAWLTAVIDHVRANPASVEHAEQLIEGLSHCRNVLRKANEIGAKWHFAMDI